MVRVFYSTGEEGGENNGLYANSEHTRCCKCGMVVGNEGRCALGWDGGCHTHKWIPHPDWRLPSCAPEKNFQIVHQKI